MHSFLIFTSRCGRRVVDVDLKVPNARGVLEELAQSSVLRTRFSSTCILPTFPKCINYHTITARDEFFYFFYNISKI